EQHTIKVTVLSGKLALDCIVTDENNSTEKKIKTVSKKKSAKKAPGKLLKKSTLLIGTGLAVAGTGLLIFGKKIKKSSDKK
ncbi:MAG: hypothetical protein MR503_07360, partial [Oscillospiraceae bacterium]|nr:hypothetical protein [Oscillospiraceae bacterium]